MLMTSKRGCKRFPFVEPREMEAFSPTVLIQFRGAIIVACDRDQALFFATGI